MVKVGMLSCTVDVGAAREADGQDRLAALVGSGVAIVVTLLVLVLTL